MSRAQKMKESPRSRAPVNTSRQDIPTLYFWDACLQIIIKRVSGGRGDGKSRVPQGVLI